MAIVSRTTSFLVTLVVAFFVFAPVGAKTPRPVAADTAATDSSRFVTASLLVITPGPDIYSVLGHTALRMQCPSKGLDYCFSFETETGLAGYLSFFAGQSHAGFMPVPTATFLAGYRQQGRGVTQYDLNLTPHEKQELWRALDNDMLEGAHRKFNLIQNNCTSMALLKIESILDDEGIDFRRMPAPMYYKNGRGVEYLSRRSPWAQFLFMTFLGSEADTDWPLENKMNPELIIPVLPQRHHTAGRCRYGAAGWRRRRRGGAATAARGCPDGGGATRPQRRRGAISAATQRLRRGIAADTRQGLRRAAASDGCLRPLEREDLSQGEGGREPAQGFVPVAYGMARRGRSVWAPIPLPALCDPRLRPLRSSLELAADTVQHRPVPRVALLPQAGGLRQGVRVLRRRPRPLHRHSAVADHAADACPLSHCRHPPSALRRSLSATKRSLEIKTKG